jgi:hypothetical protein
MSSQKNLDLVLSKNQNDSVLFDIKLTTTLIFGIVEFKLIVVLNYPRFQAEFPKSVHDAI